MTRKTIETINFSSPGVRIEPVYSREIVAGRLAAISPALFAYLALVVAGLALQAAHDPQGTCHEIHPFFRYDYVSIIPLNVLQCKRFVQGC